MIENKNRIANFTSSQMWKLMKNDKTGKGIGAPGLAYIEEKRLEMRLGRSVDVETYSKTTAWGTLIQYRVFDMLPFGYEFVGNKTYLHPSVTNWSGSPDLIVPKKKVGDIKCYYPKNFASTADVLMKQDVALFREECPEEYWQLVSNAIINKVPVAEAVLYMPYYSELEEIREFASNYEGEDQWHYRFIAEEPSSCLPYLPDGGHYQNLVRFEFEVPKEDIDALTARVLQAKKLLFTN